MNLASWIILGVVIAILALAVKATFFGKKGHCAGCSSAGDCAGGDVADGREPSQESGCPTCAGCSGCAHQGVRVPRIEV